MMNNVYKIVVLVLILLMSHVTTGQNLSGYFHAEKVIKTIPLHQEQEDYLAEMNKKFSDSLSLIMESFIDKKIPEPSVEHTPSEIRNLEDEIQKIQTTIEAYQKKWLSTLETKRKEFERILNMVLWTIINDFCQRNKVIFLVSKADLQYCEGCHDYTDELIEFIKTN